MGIHSQYHYFDGDLLTVFYLMLATKI